jgi:asparagine synthase (glutamine-hydrolysing)
VFLSGGLDSSVICGILSGLAERPVSTFSVGFDGPAAFDERRQAQSVSRHFGTDHHELQLSAVEIADELPRLIDHLAEPVMDPAMIPTYLLSRFARERVTVALTGEGADELFAGYRRYGYARRLGWLGRLPTAGLHGVGGWIPRRLGQALDAVHEREPWRAHLEWSSVLGGREASRLFDPEAYAAFERSAGEAFARYFSGTRRLEDQLRADQHEWLPHNLLGKVDRASMAVSLEARVPFLDHRLVEWAADLPEGQRLDGSRTKVVLREAFRERLPAEIVRRGKRGFDLPLAAWIRGPLGPLAREAFSAENLRRWPGLRADRAARMLELHLGGRQDFGLPLFNLLSVLIFLERRTAAAGA